MAHPLTYQMSADTLLCNHFEVDISYGEMKRVCLQYTKYENIHVVVRTPHKLKSHIIDVLNPKGYNTDQMLDIFHRTLRAHAFCAISSVRCEEPTCIAQDYQRHHRSKIDLSTVDYNPSMDHYTFNK